MANYVKYKEKSNRLVDINMCVANIFSNQNILNALYVHTHFLEFYNLSSAVRFLSVLLILNFSKVLLSISKN